MEIKKTLLCFILIFSIKTNILADYQIIRVFEEKRIDFSSKSYLGWARVLNNADKRKEYKLDDINPILITLYTDELKKMSEEKAFGGKLK